MLMPGIIKSLEASDLRASWQSSHFMVVCLSCVNFASANGLRGAAGYGAYNSSKEEIRALTRTAAREWGRDGIVVNCVCPASVAHRLPPADDHRRAAFAAAMDEHPMGRDGDPEADIAPVVLFLLSDATRYMTGQTLMVDGGAMLHA